MGWPEAEPGGRAGLVCRKIRGGGRGAKRDRLGRVGRRFRSSIAPKGVQWGCRMRGFQIPGTGRRRIVHGSRTVEKNGDSAVGIGHRCLLA